MKSNLPLPTLLTVCALALSHGSALASIAYGSINNFDAVNDTGVPAHGFDIELSDIRSTDITYTYNWNHYGTPTITEDTTSVPGHTNVLVRYASAQTNGVWEAFTAVPAGPIAPTQGHQFTNPSLNFGGEHFGVGYRANPTAVTYHWLIDNGGVLVQGPPVNIATPTFAYVPPAAGVPAQVQAAIVPPPPPVPDPLEFGEASWVKEIRTSSHNNAEVKLRNLVSKDPDYPEIKDWRNGEPDEVEIEWQILQTDHNAANGGANGELKGAPENLQQGDEVITRRYEFYKYVGPLDAETGEARADKVGPDGIHGLKGYQDTIVVGAYLGAQMSAFDVDAPLGLIEHLPDGEVNAMYPSRTVVIAGNTNFVATTSGALPDGLSFDPSNGVVSGTPMSSGVYTFEVHASMSNSPVAIRKYLFTIAEAGAILPPHSAVDSGVFPPNAGSTSGDGVYTNGEKATIVATAAPGFSFVNWTENDVTVSRSSTYPFTVDVNRSLLAHFAPAPALTVNLSQANLLSLNWPTNFSGFSLQQNSDLGTTNWVQPPNPISVVGTNHQVTITPTTGPIFYRLIK